MSNIRLNIGGPKGNAFYILGLVKDLVNGDKELAYKIRAEMKSSNYDNLLRTFKRYFPGITLYSNIELNGVDSDLYEITGNDYTEL